MVLSLSIFTDACKRVHVSGHRLLNAEDASPIRNLDSISFEPTFCWYCRECWRTCTHARTACQWKWGVAGVETGTCNGSKIGANQQMHKLRMEA